MNNLNLPELTSYIEATIWPRFHQKKLEKIEAITLNDIIKREFNGTNRADVCRKHNISRSRLYQIIGS